MAAGFVRSGAANVRNQTSQKRCQKMKLPKPGVKNHSDYTSQSEPTNYFIAPGEEMVILGVSNVGRVAPNLKV